MCFFFPLAPPLKSFSHSLRKLQLRLQKNKVTKELAELSTKASRQVVWLLPDLKLLLVIHLFDGHLRFGPTMRRREIRGEQVSIQCYFFLPCWPFSAASEWLSSDFRPEESAATVMELLSFSGRFGTRRQDCVKGGREG